MRQVRFFFDKDADLGLLNNKKIAVIGYGNQGRAQALIMRDKFGLDVIVGNIRDESWSAAERDGFNVFEISKASSMADVILILVPDEVMPEVYLKEVVPSVINKEHVVIDFASGYNVAYGFIRPMRNMDFILTAPRMIGWGMLHRVMEEERGFPVLVGVSQDVSGKALNYALAISKAMGALLPGGIAVESSFEEEAITDLFSEQTWAGALLFLLRVAFEVLTEEGIPPEVAILELYASGELVEISRAICELGLFEQLKLHSRTSQYNQLTRGPLYAGDDVKRKFKEVIRQIKDGSYAREWSLEQISGMPVFNMNWKLVMQHPIVDAERRLFELLGRLKKT